MLSVFDDNYLLSVMSNWFCLCQYNISICDSNSNLSLMAIGFCQSCRPIVVCIRFFVSVCLIPVCPKNFCCLIICSVLALSEFKISAALRSVYVLGFLLSKKVLVILCMFLVILDIIVGLYMCLPSILFSPFLYIKIVLS